MRVEPVGHRLLAFVAVLFTAMSFSSVAIALPKWVEDPKQDNAETIYGLGAGASFEAAKLAAQNEIASKIEVTVSSNTALHQQNINGAVSESFSKQVLANVKALPLGQMQVQKTKAYKDEIWVQVALSRSQFKHYQQSQLLVEDREVQRLMTQFGNLTLLQRWPLFDPVKAEINKARARLAAMTALTDFSAKPYEARYKRYLDDITATATQTVLFVRTSNISEEVALAEVIADLAKDEGLLATTNLTDQVTGSLTINSTLNNKRQGEAYGAKTTIVLTLLDDQNQVVASNEFFGSGRSYQNEADAVRRAYQSVAIRLKRMGLARALQLSDM